MEKQSEWNEVEKFIHETLVQVDVDFVHNKGGDSYVRRLYKALKEKGYLNDTHSQEPADRTPSEGVLVSEVASSS